MKHMYNYMEANAKQRERDTERGKERCDSLSNLCWVTVTKSIQRERKESNYTCCCDGFHLRANMAPIKPQMTAHLFIVQMCLFLLVKVN